MEKIVIQNQIWRAEITPARGANSDCLTCGGKEVYRTGGWEEPFFQGAAMLLPANRTYEGRFTFEGKEYQLPLNEPANNAHLHGFLWQQPFAVVRQTADAVTLAFENGGEIYPFAFRMEVTFRAEDAFVQEYRITAMERMPLTFGLHTAFRAAPFAVPLAACQEKDEHHIPTGRYLPLNEQEQGYCKGSPAQGLVISGYYRAAGHTAAVGDWLYEVSPNFDHWILFNARGERDILCIEPQAGGVNGLNSGACTVLDQGKTILYWTKIKARR